jgi:hypothetical protein
MQTIGIMLWGTMLMGASGQHWTQTSDETIWRGRYTNCDKGYAVILPDGVVAHGSLPPSSNHGILVSAEAPGTTAEVKLGSPRLIDVYDTFDVEELGSARAYLEKYQEQNAKVIETRDLTFKGLPAAYVHYSVKKETATTETEELVIYRAHGKNIGPIFYVVMVQTPAEHYNEDALLYREIRDGFHVLSVPRGECSND